MPSPVTVRLFVLNVGGVGAGGVDGVVVGALGAVLAGGGDGADFAGGVGTILVGGGVGLDFGTGDVGGVGVVIAGGGDGVGRVGVGAGGDGLGGVGTCGFAGTGGAGMPLGAGSVGCGNASLFVTDCGVDDFSRLTSTMATAASTARFMDQRTKRMGPWPERGRAAGGGGAGARGTGLGGGGALAGFVWALWGIADFLSGCTGLGAGCLLGVGAGAADAAGSFTGLPHLVHIAVPPAE